MTPIDALVQLSVFAEEHALTTYAMSFTACAGAAFLFFWLWIRFPTLERWVPLLGAMYVSIGLVYAVDVYTVLAHGPETPFVLFLIKATLMASASLALILATRDLRYAPLWSPLAIVWGIAAFGPPILCVVERVVADGSPRHDVLLLDALVSTVVLAYFATALWDNLETATLAILHRTFVVVATVLYILALCLPPLLGLLGSPIDLDPLGTLVTLVCKALLLVPILRVLLGGLPLMIPLHTFPMRGDDDAAPAGLHGLSLLALRILRADVVDFLLPVPPHDPTAPPNLVWFGAKRSGDGDQQTPGVSTTRKIMPAPAESIASWVFEHGAPLIDPDRKAKHADDDTGPRYFAAHRGMRGYVTVPVTQAGRAVGVLNVEWRRPNAVRNGTLRSAELIAQLAAPALAARRERELALAFGQRLIDLRPGEHGVAHAIATCERLLESLFPGHSARVDASGLPSTPMGAPRTVAAGDTEVSSPQVVPLSWRGESIGRLAVSPPLPDYIGQHLATAIADTVLDGFNVHLEERAVHATDAMLRARTVEELVRNVDEALRAVRLELLGTTAVPGLPDRSSELDADAEAALRDAEPPDEDPDSPVLLTGVGAVVALRLTAIAPEAALLIGAANGAHTGGVLDPGHVTISQFLARLVNAFQFHHSRVRAETARAEAAQHQALTTLAVVTGSVVHQITNLSQDIMGSAQQVDEARRLGKVQTTDPRLDTLIHGLVRTTRRLLDLGGSILRVSRLDDSRPANLSDAITEVARLLSPSLESRGASLAVPTAEGEPTLVDLPFRVLLFALANLVANAKEQVTNGGTVTIAIVVADGWVAIDVIDDGPGVPDAIRERLFELGFTTRPDGTGWGLHFARRSLRENGGELELLQSRPGHTVFRILARDYAPSPVPATRRGESPESPDPPGPADRRPDE